ncbi:MAG TPA: hypothetical protein ACFYEF_10560 [Candidatus Wunengus sp. YC63]|uniref:hypothetical protein n=1 Tax=Candidatus Wunengus sp. YC63 TaxID=3367699 RepID=UPI004029314B
MKKLLNTLLLTVFFVLGSVSGFLLPVYSYEVAQISGADTSADTVIADSQNDFSGVQGQDNWFYGYYTNCGNSSSFTQMTYDTSGWWEEAETQPPWTLLRYNGGNPSSNHCAVRRWVSEVSGDIVITGRVNKNDTSVGGDGITASILVDGVNVWSQDIAYNDSTGVTYEINATVNVDSIVDFVISPGENGNEAYDTSDFTATISGSGVSSFEVNVTGDEPDADLTDGVCDVDLSTDGNQCTLRAAIQEANKREGEDTITFESSISAISPEKSLPDITETVTIDASSHSSNVELNGSNAGKNADGFSVKKGDLTIKNLTVSGFSRNGIKSDGYVQLSTVEVTDNKAYGVFAKNDIVISGTETTVSKFNKNGKIGLYSQTGNVAANDATLQVENNGDAGIVSEGGDVIINFVPGTHLPTYVGKQSIIKGNGKSGIIANGRGKQKEDTDDEYYGNVRASHIVVEGNGVKIKKDGIALKPSLKNAGHGIYASNYVELIEPRVVDNKGYGIVSKYDVIIYGSETATNEFNNNGGAGIYSQLGNVAARDVIISVEENGRFGIGADKGGAFLNDATVINNKGIGIVVGGDLSINKGKVCDNKGGEIKVKGQESIGEDVVICDNETQ